MKIIPLPCSFSVRANHPLNSNCSAIPPHGICYRSFLEISRMFGK